jgi:hypothetical protein
MHSAAMQQAYVTIIRQWTAEDAEGQQFHMALCDNDDN